MGSRLVGSDQNDSRITGCPEFVPGQKSASGKSADVDLATLDAIAFCAG